MKSYSKNFIKNIFYYVKLHQYMRQRKYTYVSFDFQNFKQDVLSFVHSMQGSNFFEYKFSPLQKKCDLYSSVYALLIYGLFNEVKTFSKTQKHQWGEYILAHQDKDGLFRDRILQTSLAETCHYWGWHHLLPHLLIALDYLCVKPKYDFTGILHLFKEITMSDWLASRKWKEDYLAVSNEIMNIGIALQYSRDHFKNIQAGALVEELKRWLLENMRDLETSLWGYDIGKSVFDISKAVKTAYHIIPIFYFDENERKLDIDILLQYVLKTQNKFNGFGPSILANACDDIDSLYLLTILSTQNDSLQEKILKSVRSFMDWVFVNINNDGGFVFQRCQPFQYADQPILSSNTNQSNMFATWFRALSIAYTCVYLNIPHDFQFSNISGYQYHRS